ncbi:MAG: hypothetical protein Nkreftii_001591 [Candidatus Nitrospira kreftii]|uniref:Uncharacterized protein n=1 Tax=Candidatus Nitrospira kreftii TaxID=2652173 RepID=A0A7S8FDJ4_9BACT|nr:MAG: hypothetical protein Nkreftii_001591 [Candidatus Nitrospira kreftii]
MLRRHEFRCDSHLLNGYRTGCMVKIMSPVLAIGWSLRIGVVVSVSLWVSLSHAGSKIDGHSPIGPVITGMTAIPALAGGRDAELTQTPSASLPVENMLVLRTLPSVSKQISVGGTTLLPFIGAGFGGGYLTELDRSLNAVSSGLSSSFNAPNAGLKSLVGQQLIPNEVQLGIRVPF